jgi:ketosteroid isomerase-like protein
MHTDATKRTIAGQFHKALSSRDWDLMRSIVTDDIVWSLPGRSLISGEARGVGAVVERAQLIASYGLTFTLKHVLLGQHDVALSLNNTARRGDLVLDEHLAVVCLLRGGRICTINTYLSDVAMVNAFFI